MQGKCTLPRTHTRFRRTDKMRAMMTKKIFTISHTSEFSSCFILHVRDDDDDVRHETDDLLLPTEFRFFTVLSLGTAAPVVDAVAARDFSFILLLLYSDLLFEQGSVSRRTHEEQTKARGAHARTNTQTRVQLGGGGDPGGGFCYAD